MSRYTKAEIKDLAQGFIQYLSEADAPKRKAKTKVKPKANKAHAELKAELKLKPKAKQREFSQNWLEIRQKAGFGVQGNIPRDRYFELQRDAFDSIA